MRSPPASSALSPRVLVIALNEKPESTPLSPVPPARWSGAGCARRRARPRRCCVRPSSERPTIKPPYKLPAPAGTGTRRRLPDRLDAVGAHGAGEGVGLVGPDVVGGRAADESARGIARVRGDVARIDHDEVLAARGEQPVRAGRGAGVVVVVVAPSVSVASGLPATRRCRGRAARRPRAADRIGQLASPFTSS